MNKDQLRYYFFYLSAIVIIIGGLKMASQAAVIIFLSIFIASILAPLMSYLQKMKIPKSLALILILSLVFVLLLGVITSLKLLCRLLWLICLFMKSVFGV